MGTSEEKSPRRSNDPRNHDGLRAYSREFMARAQEINDIIRAAADKLEAADPEREIVPVVSYVDGLFDLIEERIVKQIQIKVEAIDKVAKLKGREKK